MGAAVTLAWPDILEEHAAESAFLFELRTLAFRSYRRTLGSLVELDDRLRAQIDGLAVAPDQAWELCGAWLESKRAGEAFVAAWLALEAGNGPPLAALEAALAAPASLDGLNGALRLSPAPRALDTLRRFAASELPLPRALALDALAFRGEDVPTPRARALFTLDHPVATLAAIGIATRRRHAELRPEIARASASPHARVAEAALQAMAMLGDPGAPAACRSAMAREDAAGAMAVKLLGMIGDATDVARLSAAARSKTHGRVASMSLARLGHSSAVEVLLEIAADPPRSRAAGHGLELMMGVSLEAERLAFRVGSKPALAAEVEDETLKLDLDDGLAAPDPEKLQRWWKHIDPRPARDQRWRSGKPFAWESVVAEVDQATLPDRDDALLELMVRLPLGHLERRGWGETLGGVTSGLAREARRHSKELGVGAWHVPAAARP
jgi:uncharacterized protein (TIGR02270 family)